MQCSVRRVRGRGPQLSAMSHFSPLKLHAVSETHVVMCVARVVVCYCAGGGDGSRGSPSSSSGSGADNGGAVIGDKGAEVDDDGSLDGGGDDPEGVSEEENFKRGQRYKKLSRLLSSVMVGAAGP